MPVHSNPHSAKITPQEMQDIINTSYQRGKPESLSKYGLEYQPELSDNEQQVYLDAKGKPIVAFRGSTLHNLGKDWWSSDVALATGLERYNPRFQKSEKLIQDVAARFGKPVTTVGHSLGGSLAEYANPTGKNITLNKGVGLAQVLKPVSSKSINIRSAHDIVSYGEKLQKGNQTKIEIPRTGHIISPLISHDVKLLSRLPNKRF